MKKITTRLLSLVLLGAFIPSFVLADNWYLEKGSISVEATESGQTVSQVGGERKNDDAPVISTHAPDSTKTGAVEYTVTINAEENATAKVTLENVNIDVSSKSEAAITTSGEGSVNIELDGTNEVQSGTYHAGVEKTNDGTLTITDENKNGSLKANGGQGGAGIGGGVFSDSNGNNITVSGGTITATGGEHSAGIGGGGSGSSKNASNITISGGNVTANGAGSAAGIGGGNGGSGTGIEITGGKVKANGGTEAAGIGGGKDGNGSGITVSGGEVIATGKDNYDGGGAGIGGGSGGSGSDITVSNGTVNATGGNYSAGIGGGKDRSGNGITVSGGQVTAKGGGFGAGIGGGINGDGSGITVSGGKVNATGDPYGAGIGGGQSGSGKNILISDGIVIANGGAHGAGIGGGWQSEGDTITISGGEVIATGGYGGAGIGGGNKEYDNRGGGDGKNINITNGKVTATGGKYGAGIGGGNGGNGSNITVSGGEVNATGNGKSDTSGSNISNGGAGIGGGNSGSGSDITVSGGEVTAQGGNGGAGIGGGENASGNDITISGGQVTAMGGRSGAGIGGGGGKKEGSGNVTVSGEAQVKVQGGAARGEDDYAEGWPIGNGGYRPSGIGVQGDEITPDISGLKVDGFIQYYDQYVDIKKAEPYKTTAGTEGDHSWDGGQVTTPATCTTPGEKTYTCKNPAHGKITVQIPALDHDFKTYIYNNNATCEADGTETAKCERCNVTRTQPAQGTKLEHQFGNYTYNGDATCEADGTKTAQCKRCNKTDTQTVQGTKLKHQFSNYIYNNDATCTQDGTETAKCDHNCGETHTRIKAGTKLGHLFETYVYNNDATQDADGTETAHCAHRGCTVADTRTAQGTKLPGDTAETAAENQAAPYWVSGPDGQSLPYQAQIKDGGLTVTVQADTASLRGSTGSLGQLEAQGITEIRFITNGAESAFTLSDLLTSGTGSFTLTHEGDTVTFTLAEKDISGILK